MRIEESVRRACALHFPEFETGNYRPKTRRVARHAIVPRQFGYKDQDDMRRHIGNYAINIEGDRTPYGIRDVLDMRLLAKIGLVFFIVAALNPLSAAEKPTRWPKIQPTSLSALVTRAQAKFVLNIYSAKNPSEKLYELRCNDGEAVDDDGVDYFGMYKCELFEKNDVGIDLIDGREHWTFNRSFNTRAVFNYDQLIGPCKNNPQFGYHRVFNVRGIKLALTVSNFSSTPMADMLSGKAKLDYRFNLEAKVTPNKKATKEYTTPLAENYCGGYYTLDAHGKTIYHALVY